MGAMGGGEDTQTISGRANWLLPFETVCLFFIVALASVVAMLLALRSVPIDLVSFAPVGILVMCFIALAIWLRHRGFPDGASLALIATALYVLYSNVGVLFNYLIVPVGAETVDPALIEWDRALGFDWANSVRLVETSPELSHVLSIVYLSSLAQLAAAILILGFTERRVCLHRMLACGIISSMTCILFWSVVPSIGPAAFVEVASPVGVVPRVVDSEYAEQMLSLLASGPSVLSANGMLGVVAFPSFHTVMMLMSIWYLRGTRFLPVFAIFNIPMLPAIIVHGGHHLVDVVAGMMLFAVCAWISARIVR